MKPISKAVDSVLTRISYTGVHRTIEKLKGGHEGEKWVTIFRYS